MRSLLSTATVVAVGLTCKAVFKTGFATVTVNGLPILLDALAHQRRNHGQGIVTVANHISTLDDPLTWGVLPLRCFFSRRNTRWALGASEIMFTNPFFSIFFRLGQTLETFRGKGVYQHAVDIAIDNLNRGDWVHLYSEGRVNQPCRYFSDENGVAHLPRFKWGVGRMVMETHIPPVVIPMWLTGFDRLMPEGRPVPYKYLPQPGVHLTITFGIPIPADEIRKALDLFGRGRCSSSTDSTLDKEERSTGWFGGQISSRVDKGPRSNLTIDIPSETLIVRAEITRIIHQAVESLGRSVCGDTLFLDGAQRHRNPDAI